MGIFNYIKSSWRGEKSLALAFWTNGFLLIVFWQVLLGIYHSGTVLFPHITRTHISEFFSIAIVLEVIAVVITIWQVVGIWRSAKYHKETTQQKFYPILAQVVIVLVAFASFVKFVGLKDYYRDVFWNALGKDALGNYIVSLSDDKKQLTVSGMISFGLASDVDELLKENTSVETVVLNSEGGRVWEGESLYDVLKKHNIKETRTETGCASACTIAFLAGELRSIKDDEPILGFHSSSSPYYLASTDNIDNRHIQTLMISHGVSNEFTRNALGTPPDEMWFPEYSELLDEKIVRRDYGELNELYDKMVSDGLYKIFDFLYVNGYLQDYSYLEHDLYGAKNKKWSLSFVRSPIKHLISDTFNSEILTIHGEDFDGFDVLYKLIRINCNDSVVEEVRICDYRSEYGLYSLENYLWLSLDALDEKGNWSNDYCYNYSSDDNYLKKYVSEYCSGISQ